MIWTDSLADVMGTGAALSTILWLGYAFVPRFLRRTVMNSNLASSDARGMRAAVLQVFLLSWVWILHGALVVWLFLPHEWWVVWGLFVAMMAGLGRTSHYVLSRLEEIVTPRGR